MGDREARALSGETVSALTESSGDRELSDVTLVG